MPPHDSQTPKNTPVGWIDWNGEQAKKQAAEEARLRSRKPLFGAEEGRGSRLLTGLIIAIAGVPSLMIGLGIWTNDSIVMAAPLMIIFCVGLLFVGGGLAFAIGFITPELEIDGSLPQSAPKKYPRVAIFLSAIAAAGLAGVATWVAFTDGMRTWLLAFWRWYFSYIDAGGLASRLDMWAQSAGRASLDIRVGRHRARPVAHAGRNGDARWPERDRKKPVPDLIRDGSRFCENHANKNLERV